MLEIPIPNHSFNNNQLFGNIGGSCEENAKKRDCLGHRHNYEDLRQIGKRIPPRVSVSIAPAAVA